MSRWECPTKLTESRKERMVERLHRPRKVQEAPAKSNDNNNNKQKASDGSGDRHAKPLTGAAKKKMIARLNRPKTAADGDGGDDPVAPCFVSNDAPDKRPGWSMEAHPAVSVAPPPRAGYGGHANPRTKSPWKKASPSPLRQAPVNNAEPRHIAPRSKSPRVNSRSGAPPTPTTPPRKVMPSDLAPEKVRRRMSRATRRFRLEGLLGKGAFGEVRAAVDTRSGEAVAVKVIPVDGPIGAGSSKEAVLLREVAIQMLITHPNVVCLKELVYNKAKQELWLVMELISGRSLEAIIQEKKRLGEDQTNNLYKQLVVGMDYLHTANIAHRDLKPDNVMVTRGGVIKIADFGLANVHRERSKSMTDGKINMHTCCGTPYFIAPEVIEDSQGKGYNGFKADIWSMGVMLFYMLSGSFPFEARDLALLFHRIVNQDLSLPSSIPSAVHSLLRLQLQKAPAARPTLKEVGQHPWVGLPPEAMVKETATEDDLQKTMNTIINIELEPED